MLNEKTTTKRRRGEEVRDYERGGVGRLRERGGEGWGKGRVRERGGGKG